MTKAVARMRVEFVIDGAENLRAAEKKIDQWLVSGEEDDGLIEYRVIWEESDWMPWSDDNG